MFWTKASPDGKPIRGSPRWGGRGLVMFQQVGTREAGPLVRGGSLVLVSRGPGAAYQTRGPHQAHNGVSDDEIDVSLALGQRYIDAGSGENKDVFLLSQTTKRLSRDCMSQPLLGVSRGAAWHPWER